MVVQFAPNTSQVNHSCPQRSRAGPRLRVGIEVTVNIGLGIDVFGIGIEVESVDLDLLNPGLPLGGCSLPPSAGRQI